MRWVRPVRARQISAAASAEAATLTCTAVPTANEEGRTGSAPVKSILASAARSWPQIGPELGQRVARLGHAARSSLDATVKSALSR